MKAITLTAPWAWAVTSAGKDVENRKTRCPSLLGERIAIHAGIASKDGASESDAFEYMIRNRLIGGKAPRPGVTYGAIVAVATIIGWASGRTVVSAPDYEADAVCHDGAESRWFMGPIGWLLHDVRTLHTPIPARGKQGIWTVDAEAEARILAQVGGA